MFLDPEHIHCKRFRHLHTSTLWLVEIIQCNRAVNFDAPCGVWCDGWQAVWDALWNSTYKLALESNHLPPHQGNSIEEVGRFKSS